MTNLTEEQLWDVVLNWVRENSHNPEATNGKLDKDTDLMEIGALDSIAFIDLIGFIEEKTRSRIELADIDPEEFMTVGGLCRHALKSQADS